MGSSVVDEDHQQDKVYGTSDGSGEFVPSTHTIGRLTHCRLGNFSY